MTENKPDLYAILLNEEIGKKLKGGSNSLEELQGVILNIMYAIPAIREHMAKSNLEAMRKGTYVWFHYKKFEGYGREIIEGSELPVVSLFEDGKEKTSYLFTNFKCSMRSDDNPAESPKTD